MIIDSSNGCDCLGRIVARVSYKDWPVDYDCCAYILNIYLDLADEGKLPEPSSLSFL